MQGRPACTEGLALARAVNLPSLGNHVQAKGGGGGVA
jgi:hypothetical protein